MSVCKWADFILFLYLKIARYTLKTFYFSLIINNHCSLNVSLLIYLFALRVEKYIMVAWKEYVLCFLPHKINRFLRVQWVKQLNSILLILFALSLILWFSPSNLDFISVYFHMSNRRWEIVILLLGVTVLWLSYTVGFISDTVLFSRRL